MFPDATLCGLARADGTVDLAPDDDTLILEDDEVVMLSETSVVTVTPADEASIPPRGSERYYMQCIDDVPNGRVRILFAGWNSETMVALNLAQSMAPAGSEITILSDSIPPREMAELRSTSKCKLRLLHGVPTSYVDLERAKVQEMDAVIVMPDHAQGKAEEDASVLATMLQTHAICADAAPGLGEPHVVATLNTESAKSIVQLMGKVGAGEYQSGHYHVRRPRRGRAVAGGGESEARRTVRRVVGDGRGGRDVPPRRGSLRRDGHERRGRCAHHLGHGVRAREGEKRTGARGDARGGRFPNLAAKV